MLRAVDGLHKQHLLYLLGVDSHLCELLCLCRSIWFGQMAASASMGRKCDVVSVCGA